MSKPRKSVKSEINKEIKKDKDDLNMISGNLNVDARPKYYEKVSKNDEKLIDLEKKEKLAKHAEKLKKPYIGQKNRQYTKNEQNIIESMDNESPIEDTVDTNVSNSKGPLDYDESNAREPEDRLCEGKKNKKECK